MAYNYYPTTYQMPVYYPSQVNNQFPYQSQAQQSNGIIWVQGESGAKSYLVAPNTSVTLWDTESPTIYVKSADATGMPSMKTLDYTMRESGVPETKISPVNDYATKDDISSIKAEIESLRSNIESMKGAKK